MALTLTRAPATAASSHGDNRGGFFDVTFDASYTTGGLSLVPRDVGLFRQINFLLASPVAGLYFEYDYTNQKLLAKFPTGGAAASPTTLAAPVGAGASGAVAVTSSAATVPVGLTPGVGKEVAATANLAAVTTRVFVLGI